MIKIGLVERWNNFAKKSIYINHDFEIGCGRLVFVGLLTFLETISVLLLGAPIVAIIPLWSNMLLSLKKKEKD